MTPVKQKVILVLIAITFLILVWEIYQTFFYENKALAESNNIVLPLKKAKKSGVNNIVQSITRPNQGTNEWQTHYLALINQYQIVHLENLIVKQQAEIARAKMRMENSYHELGLKPSWNLDDNFAKAQVSELPKHYILKYVAFKNKHWTAILQYGSQYYNVHIGSVLASGEIVTNINQTSLVLNKKNKQEMLLFNSM